MSVCTDNPITLPLDHGWPRRQWLWSLFMATGDEGCDDPPPVSQQRQPDPEDPT